MELEGGGELGRIKELLHIDQKDEGGINPETNLREETLWELHFGDATVRTMGRVSMIDLISKGTMPPKTAFSFKRWKHTSPTAKIFTWTIVYDDYDLKQMPPKLFYELLTNGHQILEDKNKERENNQSAAKPEPQDFTISPKFDEEAAFNEIKQRGELEGETIPVIENQEGN
jgi:hypothetical protein